MADIPDDVLDEVEQASRPFEAAVFNDNGDVTISQWHLGTRHWLRLTHALAILRAERPKR